MSTIHSTSSAGDVRLHRRPELGRQGRGRVVRQGRHCQPPRVHGWTDVRFTDNTTQAANMMLGLRVIGPSTPCRLAIRHMSNERIHNTYERDCGSFRNHPMRVVGGLDVPHTLVRDGAVFGLRGSCRVGRVQRYVEGIFSRTSSRNGLLSTGP